MFTWDRHCMVRRWGQSFGILWRIWKKVKRVKTMVEFIFSKVQCHAKQHSNSSFAPEE